MSVVHVSVKPSCMFCRCLAVDKIEECEEHRLEEDEELSSEDDDVEMKELRFTTNTKDDEDPQTLETDGKYGFPKSLCLEIFSKLYERIINFCLNKLHKNVQFRW